VTTIATGGRIGAVAAPDEETLRNQPDSLALVGELPTSGLISGDQETQESIEEVQELLGGFDSNTEK